MKKITISAKSDLFNEEWTPKIVAESNGQLIKLAKGSGELVWHSHENEDELFLVLKASLRFHYRGDSVALGEGEMFVVPKGVEHCPVAEPGSHDDRAC